MPVLSLRRALLGAIGCGRISRGQLVALRRKGVDRNELDRDELLAGYVDEGRSICQIAQERGVRPSTVLASLVLHGIPLRSRGVWLPPARGGWGDRSGGGG